MKRVLLLLLTCTVLFSSCGIFRSNRTKPGNPIGAEKILANDPGAIKAAKKANRNTN